MKDGSDSGGHSIIYGTSSDPEEQKALKALRKQVDRTLSPRTKLLHKGMFPPTSVSKNASRLNFFQQQEDHLTMNLEDVGFTLQEIG